VAHPECDDDKAEGIDDQRQKMANGGIGKDIALIPRSQPCLYDGWSSA
jgi:hypothetical protein